MPEVFGVAIREAGDSYKVQKFSKEIGEPEIIGV
jgi:hypothetical protein